jgi:hypothetical protein
VQFTFKETPDFVSTKGALTDEELRAVQDELLRNPEAGDRSVARTFGSFACDSREAVSAAAAE